MKPPYFWSAGLDPRSRAAAPLTRALLTPASAVWASVTARRMARTDGVMLPVPVICIGNLTVGGSGKTPVARTIRDHLLADGRRAATLSRGYGGKLKAPTKVSPHHHSAEDVGDEPLLLAQSGEAWIAADRAAGGQAMVADGVECIILDDGHQNPSLKKTASIIVIDSEAPFGNGFVVPKGPLREPVPAGLARATAVILMGAASPPPELSRFDGPLVRAELVRTNPLPEGPLVAFAGIGRPEKFFDSLRRDGADLADTVGYADHHRYRPSDLSFLRQLARDHDAQLVTTAKDMMRLPVKDRTGIVSLDVSAVFQDISALSALLDLSAQETSL
ncbi:MAG: tetraacyldisaccharide 4'-kinase [Pseudomonadota bacterium]